MSALVPLAGLLRQIRDLKRVRDARSPRSLAERRFARAWARLVAGEAVEAVAFSETAGAVAEVRLAGLDAGVMRAHRLTEAEAVGVLERAFADVAGPVEPGLRGRLRAELGSALADHEPATGGGAGSDEPGFVAALIGQPRAGATHPGLPRLVLEPAESHGDHCATTAVFGVLLAPQFGADPARVFLIGLSHHLFNVSLPDAGFAGDVLIGDDLLGRMATAATERAVGTLPPALRPAVRDALSLTTEGRFGEPEAQAFHAADVLDRVLEMAWHERSARFRLSDALGADTEAGQLDVCHGGFYQGLQRRVLRAAGVLQDGMADRDDRPSGSYERGGHGAVPAASPLAGGPGGEDGRTFRDGTEVAHLERRELGS